MVLWVDIKHKDMGLHTAGQGGPWGWVPSPLPTEKSGNSLSHPKFPTRNFPPEIDLILKNPWLEFLENWHSFPMTFWINIIHGVTAVDLRKSCDNLVPQFNFIQWGWGIAGQNFGLKFKFYLFLFGQFVLCIQQFSVRNRLLNPPTVRRLFL